MATIVARVGDIVWFHPKSVPGQPNATEPLAAIVLAMVTPSVARLGVISPLNGSISVETAGISESGELGGAQFIAPPVPVTPHEQLVARVEALEAAKPVESKFAPAPFPALPQNPGESNADYKIRNDANQKRLADDWKKENPAA